MFFSLMHEKVLARKILTNTKSCRTVVRADVWLFAIYGKEIECNSFFIKYSKN